MAMRTDISWADATWNPFFGCTKVGPGCDHCYAIFDVHRKSFNSRLAAYYGTTATQKTDDGYDWTGEVFKNSPAVWSLPLRTKRPTVFFVNSLSGLFHENISDDDIVAVFEIMHACPQHQFQVLTKRPNRMVRMTQAGLLRWTPNLWAGVTIENNSLVRRADLLRKIPSHIRFISAEPLLGPLPDLDLTGIDWLIVGGESGPGARPMSIEWARDLRDRCIQKSISGEPIVFHFKQWGAFGADGGKRTKEANGYLLDGATWQDLPRKVVVATHGAHSLAEFSGDLKEQKVASEYAPIVVATGRARIVLRDVVLETLSHVPSMEARELARHNLTKVGLDPSRVDNVNIHAWALSDLVRKRRIRRFKADTGKLNRLKRPVMMDHYEVVK